MDAPSSPAQRPFLASLRSRPWRIFLIAWLVYSVHFATNVVREHYPAFSLVDHGTFRVDEYEGFHADIFVHRDGHAVIGNQVFVSALAAIPLLIFDPLLDAVERHSRSKIAEGTAAEAEYRTDKRNSARFFRLVSERGLAERFGAATFVTTAFFMAPLTAAFLAFFYRVLRRRGVERGHAAAITLLLGFGTPVFFRTTGLNHNMFVMYGTFVAFAMLWAAPDEAVPVPRARRLLAGLWGGITIATDYIGLVILPILYAYLVIPRALNSSWKTAIRESLGMVAGALPPVAFLLYSQWAMYGNPFLPGQYWMTNTNLYVNEGVRGFTLPDWDLFLQNLFHPGFGLYTWGPLMLLGLVPAWWYRPGTLILPRRERVFVVALFAALLLFCSANQYSRLQWNSGFRYLVPLVPFVMLQLADHWVRLPSWARGAIAGTAVLHCWVLTVFREPVPQSWSLLLSEGVQLPWFRVLQMTSAPDGPVSRAGWLPVAILLTTVVVAAAIWQYGATRERHNEGVVW